LHDFGDDTLPARFGLAIDYLNSAGMNEAGQKAAAAVCLWLLTSRLELFADHQRYPMAQEKIERPMIVVGEPRSGTTLLHALLAEDPNGRALRFWEVMYPSPPPGLAKPDDPRGKWADDNWREILQKIPNWLVGHPYSDQLGNSLPEDERLWALDFRTMTPTAWWRVPLSVTLSGLPQDPRAQYRIHKMMLQHFQYARPKKYWVLKGTFHHLWTPALLEAYPDAHIIWIHRDPVQVVASRIVMMEQMQNGLVGHFDKPAAAAQLLDGARASYGATLNDPTVNDPRVHHVRYQDFVADQIGTMAGYYAKFDVPFGPETETAMRHYLANNKGDRYGKFRYAADSIGVDVGTLNAEFAPYRERFGLAIEHRK
jgi:hypothetical protein